MSKTENKGKGKSRAELRYERVLAAYQERMSKRRPPGQPQNLVPGAGARKDLHLIRRKCSAKRRDGQPCNAPAVRGADTCNRHGGATEAPAGRGNIRRLLDGRLEQWARASAARRYLREAPPEALAAVDQHAARPVIKANGARHAINRREGVEAWITAKRGDARAWTAWIAAQPAVAQEYRDQPIRSPLEPGYINDRKGKK